MAYWIIRQKAINVFVPDALSCNDPLRKTLSRVLKVGSDTIGNPFLLKVSQNYPSCLIIRSLDALNSLSDFSKKGVLKLKLQKH
jgi:hypothetical protein